MKYIFRTLLFVGLFNCNAVFAQNDSAEKPYKATMVAECIDERACLKYVFLHEVIENYKDVLKESRIFALQRWNGSIYIGLFGVSQSVKGEAYAYGLSVLEINREISPYFSHHFQMTDDREKMNVAIIFGANLEEDIPKFRDDLLTIFSPDFIKLTEGIESDYPRVIKVSENNIYTNGAILVEKDMPKSSCYFSLITNFIGINEYPSTLFSLSDYNDCNVTNLHRIILTILYERIITPGMNVQEIEDAFDAFYNKLFKIAQSHKMKPSELINERALNTDVGKHIVR